MSMFRNNIKVYRHNADILQSNAGIFQCVLSMFRHEMKEYARSTFVWTCSLSLLIIIFMSFFPAFSKDTEQLRNLFKGLPEGVRKALGLSLESFTSLPGFYSYILMYATLCGSIQAMNMGISILSKEVHDKTADFLLTRPVGRSSIVTAKLMAALASIVITDTIYFIVSHITSTWVATEAFNEKTFLMLTITLPFIQLIFLSLGVLFSAVAGKIKSVVSVSLGTVFAFFVINMFGSVIGEKTIRYLTPFKYFDSIYIIENAAYEIRFVILGIILIAVFTVAAYLVYMRKDIHTI